MGDSLKAHLGDVGGGENKGRLSLVAPFFVLSIEVPHWIQFWGEIFT